MDNKNNNQDDFFHLLGDDSSEEIETPSPKVKKLYPTHHHSIDDTDDTEELQVIPLLNLPTRWERLEPYIGDNNDQVRSIVRPVRDAMDMVRRIVDYLQVTGGCNLFVIRADTGSGKTTFLNTLRHYMTDVNFHVKSLDLQTVSADKINEILWELNPLPNHINMFILEGRENPESIPSEYIKIVLANINRLSRTKKHPMLFVIPTVETEVARVWCTEASKLGDLIPKNQIYGGSQWYDFPGVPKEDYIEIVEETVRSLNQSRNLRDFGVTDEEIKIWSDTSASIGEFIETLATKIANRRSALHISTHARKERLFIIFSCPEYMHYDKLYHLVYGLVKDNDLSVSPHKVINSGTENAQTRKWKDTGREWAKFLAAIAFLDVRVINFPISTVVAAALAHGDDELLDSFKQTKLIEYKEKITKHYTKVDDLNWDEPLVSRQLTKENARKSLKGTNLYALLRQVNAEPRKGGNSEHPRSLAQYLHLRSQVHETHLHYYISLTLKDLFEHEKVLNFKDIASECPYPYIVGIKAPQPDITVYAEPKNYLLEFHFTDTPLASSQIARYAVRKIETYMNDLAQLSSILQSINSE